MVDMKQPVSLVVAVMDYFGRLPGQTISEFQGEYRKLDEKDRQFFTAELSRIGYQIKAS